MKKILNLTLFTMLLGFGLLSHAETAVEAFASRSNTALEEISVDPHLVNMDASVSRSLNSVMARLVTKFAQFDLNSIQGLDILKLNNPANMKIFFFLLNGTVCKIERQYQDGSSEHIYFLRCINSNASFTEGIYFDSKGNPLFAQ